jgi:hypothetical protein
LLVWLVWLVSLVWLVWLVLLVSMAMPACVAMRVVCNTQKAVLKKLMRNDRGASTFLESNVYVLTRNIYLKKIADYLFNEY